MNCCHALSKLLIWMVLANAAALAIGIVYYPEPFSPVMDPVSWLGKVETAQGYSNTPVFLLTTVVLLTDAVLWRYAMALLKNCRFGRRLETRILGWMVAAGYAIMAFPCDKFILLHSLGGALLVGGLWAFTTFSLYYQRVLGYMRPAMHFCLQSFLHIPAVFCGINFVMDSPLKGFSQKPLILAILVNTALGLRVLVRTRKGCFALKARSELLF